MIDTVTDEGEAVPRPHRNPVLEPEPDKTYAAAIRQLRWDFDDSLAAEIAPGKVLRLEVVVRVEALRSHKDGPRWTLDVLEISKASDE